MEHFDDSDNEAIEEIEPDYDDDEDDEDRDRSHAHKNYSELQSSTRAKLVSKESISMGTLSDHSRMSGRMSADEVLTDYTTDGGSDREGMIRASGSHSWHPPKTQRSVEHYDTTPPSDRYDTVRLPDACVRERTKGSAMDRPRPHKEHTSSHFQTTATSIVISNNSKVERKRNRKSSKDSTCPRPVITYEQQFSISDGEKDNLTAQVKPDPPLLSLQVPIDGDLGSQNEHMSGSSHAPVGHKSSNTSVEMDIDELANDPELGESLSAMIRQRRRSLRGTRKGKALSRKRSIRLSKRSHDSSDPRAPQDGLSTRDENYLDIFRHDAADSSEMEIRDNIRIQEEIISEVRMQPWSMRRKLRTLRLAKAYVERYEGRLSRGHGYQEAGAKYWRWFKREFVNLASFFLPWEMRIKRIESHFGSVVSSYFTFLRWLFGLNIVITLISVGFIVVPELLVGDPIGSTPRKAVPEQEEERALNLETVLDWAGYIKHSFLFYGYYGDAETIGRGYRLPLAYFLAGLSIYVISFIIILRKMAKNSRILNLSPQDEQYVFTWKTFTTWDFMIGHAETAKNKSAEILTNFREVILEEQEKKRDENKKTLIFLRVVANFLVMAVLASSTYAIYLLVQRSHQVEQQVARGEKISWFVRNEVSLAMSLITAIFPSIFDLIGLMEKYHPRVNLRWQLARILLLYFLNLYTLIIALYGKITDFPASTSPLCNTTTTPYDFTVTSPPHTLPYNSSRPTEMMIGDGSGGHSLSTQTNCTTGTDQQSGVQCWETMIGQEMCKLSFFDTITTLGMIILIDFIRGLFVRVFGTCWCWDLERKFPEYGEFKIAENLLHLIYNQATTWLGAFFAPVLPGLNLVKLLIMVYIRSWAVLVCNIPHERVFRASKSNNFYYAITLLMLFLVALLVGFLLVSLEPSRECGPFTSYERSYQVFTQTLMTELPDWAQPILDYVASPGIIIPLFSLLFMAIYYLASVTRSLKEANKDLREQLIYERTEEKRKIYAMADGRKADDKDKATGLDTSHRSPDRVKASLSKRPSASSKAPRILQGQGQKQLKVLRVPGMTLQQAAALKTKNPNVRIMSAEEARRLRILPVGHTSYQNTPPTRSIVTGAPPVAVVHGKPSDQHRLQHKKPAPDGQKKEVVELDQLI